MNDFLNNILARTKELAGIATKKTGEVVESSKLKVEAIKLDAKIKVAYENLGIAVYAMVKEDCKDIELVLQLAEDIDTLYEQLEDVTASIDMYKNSIVCPICESKNGYNNVFCCQCGAELLVYDEDDDDDEFFAEECDCGCNNDTDCSCAKQDNCECDECHCGCSCDTAEEIIDTNPKASVEFTDK